MFRWITLTVAAALLPAPALANPPAKKPVCQTVKSQQRDTKRPEVCHKAAPIPWVVDPTPLFLASATRTATTTVTSIS